MQLFSLRVAAGDLIAQRERDGRWSVIKILCVDRGLDGGATAHCRGYAPVSRVPAADEVPSLPVRISHVAMDAAEFARGWKRIGNAPVTPVDQEGFFVHLRATDFPRFLHLSGEDPKSLVRRANTHYQQAYALGEAGRHQEAIAEYDRAIELFPPFFEAVDNRALTFMDLGDHATALAGFEESLRVNPDGVAAFFSRGDCLLRLGRVQEAEAVFAAGLERFPAQRENFERHLSIARASLGSGAE